MSLMNKLAKSFPPCTQTHSLIREFVQVTFFSPKLAETPIRTIPIIKVNKCDVIE